MSRPGFVLDVDERTPPLLVHAGESLRLERFPQGTRVIYPPESLPGVPDLDATISRALEQPEGSEPLRALLRPGMRLTIAFDDLSLPLPPMRTPDVRGRIIEKVLTLAAEAGVDDVELIVATALHRRMTAAEIRRAVGERVFRSFWPDALYNFDAEDRDNLRHIGLTDQGEDVEISRRAAESDLLVYVNINLVAMDGGHKSAAIGLASYKSLRHHHNSSTMVHSRSFMDPEKSALHSSAWRMGRLLAGHLKIFQIETTLNNAAFPAQYGFLTKREWEWSLRDQAMFYGASRGLDAMPARLRRRTFQSMTSDYEVTGITGGEVEAVHAKTLAAVHRQQLVEVSGQSDVLVFGLPFLGPYNVNSVMNPILAMCLGLGYFFNMYRGKPLVRPGGTLILYHPVPHEFSQLHHPSYVDFFEEVLAESTDPATIEAKFEKAYATDPWYVHLYRTSHAYHGVHPFYMWYWGAHALDHLGDVIWVGADRRTTARMGFRAASSLADALEMASGSVGRSPSITYLHSPPHAIAGRDVTSTGRPTLRAMARGWRWGSRPLVPASAEPHRRPPGPPREFSTSWARTPLAREFRGVAQALALKPLVWSEVAPQVSGLDALAGLPQPAIFAANHASHLDAPLVLCALPTSWRRNMLVAAAADYFFGDWRRAVGTALVFGTVPLDRTGAASATTPLDLLKEGWSLLLFPEGTRAPDGQQAGFKTGAARLAHAAGVPVVPIGVRGSFAAMPRGRSWPVAGRPRVSVRFGPPMWQHPGESAKRFTNRLAAEVTRLAAEDRGTWWESLTVAGASAQASPVPAPAHWRRVWSATEPVASTTPRTPWAE